MHQRTKMRQLADEIRHDIEVFDQSQDPTIRRHIIETSLKLCSSAEKPAELVYRVNSQLQQNVCLLLGLNSGVFDLLVGRHGEPTTADELSARVKLDPVVITRFMRVNTAIGLCEETGSCTFASSPVTEAICTPAVRGSTKTLTEKMLPIASKTDQFMKETGLNQFSDRSANRPDIYEFTYGKSMWEDMETDQEFKKAFDNHMSMRKAENAEEPWYDVFPAAKVFLETVRTEPEAVTLIDIGGGIGQDLIIFRQQYPGMPGRHILQDLPHTLQNVDPSHSSEIELMPHDFFTAQPIKGARAYMFRGVLHDWSDEDCCRILSHIAEAMAEDSRLLIDEYVVPDEGASLRVSCADMLMLMLPGGIERTQSQWKRLFDTVRPKLEIVKVWTARPDKQSVIEAMRADRAQSRSNGI